MALPFLLEEVVHGESRPPLAYDEEVSDRQRFGRSIQFERILDL